MTILRAARIALLTSLCGTVVLAQSGEDLLVGQGSGEGRLRLFGTTSPAATLDLLAFGPASSGLRVASANVDGGPVGELLVAPGPGPAAGPHVRGFHRTGAPVGNLSFFAYATPGRGASVAGGTLDGDPFDEIVTGPGPAQPFGPHVRGFDHDGTGVVAIPGVSLFAFSTLAYGVNVAAADADGDGVAELLVAPGPGAVFALHVKGFDVDGRPARPIGALSFIAGSGRHGGEVAGGDLDDGGNGGWDEIAVAPGPDPLEDARVRGFSFDGSVAALPGFDVTPFPTSYGARVALGDAAGPAGENDGRLELLTAPGPDPGAAGTVAIHAWDGVLLAPAAPDVAAFSAAGGAWVAGGEAEVRLRCNGDFRLCDRRYNEVCEVCTHNAMSSIEDGFYFPTPNQRHSFRRQLDDGVRCMMLDTYMEQGVPSLCHAWCGWGATSWVGMLQDLDAWMEARPNEVVTFILEAYLTEVETQQALVDGGVFGRVYHHAAPPGSPWPTLREMLERGERLVAFTDDAAANGDWHLDWRRYGWETPYDDPTFTCVHGRGDPAAYADQVFILNHYTLCPLGGCEENALVNNEYTFLHDRAARCWRYDAAENPWTQIPTFINVDHYHAPAPGSVSERPDALDARDALNRAWPSPPPP